MNETELLGICRIIDVNPLYYTLEVRVREEQVSHAVTWLNKRGIAVSVRQKPIKDWTTNWMPLRRLFFNGKKSVIEELRSHLLDIEEK